MKFRVWDKFRKAYINTNSDDIYLDTEGDLYKYHEWIALIKQSDYIIEYAVGIEDKNKIEIYEGDILKLEFEDKPSYVNYRRAWFELVGIRFERPSDSLLGNYFPEFLEVIGNIHQNPELLEKTNG